MKNFYKVEGMHCKSCEILIEDKISKENGVKNIKVSLAKKEIEIESEKIISLEKLNNWFRKNGYSFSEVKREKEGNKFWWWPAIVIILGFLGLNKLGLAGFLNINSQSSLITFFVLGLVAGVSTCGALLSGIILSYPGKTFQILIGRLIGYTILGAILGIVGQGLTIGGLSNVLIILISILMTILGLQMLGIGWAQKINLSLPKSISKKVINEKTPWILGLLTVLLPCGFTLLTESVAIMSGNWLSGTLIMASFVAGSSIPLFLIGMSSEKFLKNQKVIGLLVLFFVIYNLNFQFGILNSSKHPFDKRQTLKTENREPAKVVKLTYTRFLGLSPNSITVESGEKVRLEIEVKENEYGCMSTIMLPGLFNRAQTLRAGTILILEFTPTKIGRYQFTCAMGVPHKGEVNVVK